MTGKNNQRLFLDQMIDAIVLKTLRTVGFDVECAFEKGLSRANDLDILDYCISQNRILVTLDEHFGDWTVIRLDRHAGVIRIKVDPAITKNILDTLIPFLEHHPDHDLTNKLVIIRISSIRWISTGT